MTWCTVGWTDIFECSSLSTVMYIQDACWFEYHWFMAFRKWHYRRSLLIFILCWHRTHLLESCDILLSSNMQQSEVETYDSILWFLYTPVNHWIHYSSLIVAILQCSSRLKSALWLSNNSIVLPCSGGICICIMYIFIFKYKYSRNNTLLFSCC